MAPLAFSAHLPVAGSLPARGRALSSRAPASGAALRMSAADAFQARSQTAEAKAAATPFGVYTVQCTEGTSGGAPAEAARLAALARSFRLRQAPARARYADLFETRRAAVIGAAGSHAAEGYAVRFPARAAASVLGAAEAARACARYFGRAEKAEEFMFECVDRQYKAARAPYGTYTTACCDGRVGGDAETARVAGLGAQFRAGTMGAGAKAQMRYNASLAAVFSGRGCSYEEEIYTKYPKVAAAIRWGTGAYAAGVGGVNAVMGGKLLTVAEQVAGVNLASYWPGNAIRPAVERKSAPWSPSPIKNYGYMSAAAVEFGVKAQQEPFKESPYEAWTPDWKPKSVLIKQ